MNEQRPGHCGPNYKAIIPLIFWMLAASLLATGILVATNWYGWTRIALWAPPAFAMGLLAYAFAFGEWLEWGKRRRARGRMSLFGLRWRVGATVVSDTFVFGTLVTAIACLVGGIVSDHAIPGVFILWVLPVTWSWFPLMDTKGWTGMLSPMLACVSFVPINLAFHWIRHQGASGATIAVAVVYLAIGVAFLFVMIVWHAHGAWIAEHETESPAP